MYRILLILLTGIESYARQDIGDIPYEDRGNLVTQRFRSIVVPTAGRDYGDIPYEEKKGFSKHRDYGNIPYEKGNLFQGPEADFISFGAVNIEEYGNIPYEKEVGSTSGKGIDSIRGKIKEILGGREIPELVKTKIAKQTENTVFERASAALFTLSSKMAELTALPSIVMRADDSATEDYVSPPTIDDVPCPKNQNCSTCKDTQGYRIYCINSSYSTTPAPSDIRLLINVLLNLTKDYEDYNTPKLLDRAAFEKTIFAGYPSKWPQCENTPTETTTVTTTGYPPHEDDGRTIQKCYVCGMMTTGIPSGNSLCADSFLSHAYKKHCKYIDSHNWFFNGTADFYMWGRWTGGCTMRFVDITPIYTQRSCRNRNVPTLGASFVSRRLAKLEFALMKYNDSCITTPHASLVPLSRGISLYSKMTVCVCSTDYCNRSERNEGVVVWYMIVVSVLWLG